MNVIITEHWDAYLESFLPSQKDIYYTEAYVRLNTRAGQDAQCIVASQVDKVFILPFLRNTVHFNGTSYYDFETAYGYGGGIANTDDAAFIHDAWLAVYDHLHDNNYVCGFVRFHPMLKNYQHVPSQMHPIYDRHTIVIDLQPELETIWKEQIVTSNRSDILRAERRGLTFRKVSTEEGLPVFKQIYAETMQRLHADDFYYFTDEYFANAADALPNLFVGIEEYENELVAAAMFMHNGYYGHYHLSGSKSEYQRLCPNNHMLWQAVKVLKEHGCKFFHLGGGTDGNEENSLYRFKQKFSHENLDFYIGKPIFLPEVYQAICAEWEKRNPAKVEMYKRVLLKYHY